MPWKPAPARRRDARPPSNQRGYGYAHRQWRTRVLRAWPHCADPFGKHPDLAVPSTVADHIIPLSRGGDSSLENGQGLCASCHGIKIRLEQVW